jgi:hypothetical protein
LSEINADGKVATHELAHFCCSCEHLRPRRVFRHTILRFAVCFPVRVSRNHEKFADPWAGVKPRHPKKLGSMFFYDLLRLLSNLDDLLNVSLLIRVIDVIAIGNPSLRRSGLNALSER